MEVKIDKNGSNKIKGKLGRFEIMHTIGDGASCKVKLGYDTLKN